MKAKDLEKKSVAELWSLARERGIRQKSGWKKADLIKSLVQAKPSKAGKKAAAKKIAKKTAKKVSPKKTAKKVAKKTTEKVAKKVARKKTAKAAVSQKPKAKKPGKVPAGKKGAARAKTSLREPKAIAPAGILREKVEKPGIPGESPAGLPSLSRITLMVIDPYKLFAFWEIDEQEVYRIAKDGEGYATILRIYFFREGEETGFFDVPVTESTGRKYIEVIPDRGYQVEFGILKGEQYFPIVKSRLKFTPTFRIAKGDLSPEEADIFLSQIPHPKVRISS